MFISYPSSETIGKRASGFSLIELLVVIVIVSALLAIAVPTLSHPSSNALQASREIVKAQLRQARSHAISKRIPTALIIASENHGNTSRTCLISSSEVTFENGAYLPISDDSGNSQLIQRFLTLPGNAQFVSAARIDSDKVTVLDAQPGLQTHYRGDTQACHFIVFGANGQILHPAPGTPVHIAIATTRGPKEIGAFELIHVNRLTAATRSVQP